MTGGIRNSFIVSETMRRTLPLFLSPSVYFCISSRKSVSEKYQLVTSRISGVSPVSVLFGAMRFSGMY